MIRDWARNLKDPKLSKMTKENYYSNLKTIREFCEIEMRDFDRSQRRYK